MSELRRVSELYKKAISLGQGDRLRSRWLDALLSATVDDFRTSGIKVELFNRDIGENVYLVSDETLKQELESAGIDAGCIYTVDEAARMFNGIYSYAELKSLHEAKRRCNGSFVDMPPGVFDDATFFALKKLPQDRLASVKISLGRLAGRIAGCRRCSLYVSRSRIVAGEGYPGSIMVVGEAPGRQENATGRPFVGKAGKVLNDLLALAGLKREEVYITNVVKCRPTDENEKDRKPYEEEVDACSLHIKQQLLVIRPELVIALGATALRYFLPGAYMQDCHGKFFRQDGMVVYPTYHPAASFYKRDVADILQEDFIKLGSHIGR